MLKTFQTSYIGKKKSRAVTALSLLFLMLCLTGCSMEGVPFANWDLSINSLNFPLFSRLPAIENSIYVSFSLVFALMG